MLIGSAAVAFQVDADAQSRNGASRSATTTRSSGSSSNANRSSSVSTQEKQAVTRSSSQTRQSSSAQTARPSNGSRTVSRQSVTRPATQSTRPSVQSTRPSSQSTRPSASRPATRPSVQQSRPSVQTKPSTGAPNNRPQSGTVTTRKPSPTVNRPAAGQARPDTRPAQRPGAGSAFKPDRVKDPVKVKPYHKPSGPRVHPIHRDFIAYDRPPHFWSPHYHYFGHRVRVLPSRARVHVHFGVSYYCYNDIWYRPYGGYYVICRPPFGTVLAANLIADMAWSAVRFSYYNTVLNNYRQINENNKYIAEQNEIIARNNATIAAQNAAIAMNRQQAETAFALADELGLVQSYAAADGEYFYQDGVFYAKDASGEYKVIVPPAGALVDSLPDDYEMITLADNNEYYKVDDTVFKVTLSEGKPFFEVLGQLSA